MSNATAAFGVIFAIGDGGSPEAFTNVAEVKDFDGPSLDRNTYEVTHHSSPNRWREFIPGLRDAGETSFTLNWIPSDTTQDRTTGLLSHYLDDQIHNYRIIYPDSGAEQITFPGIMTAFEPSAPVDGVLEAEVTIKIAGEPTFA